jgi:hypothetical protein
VVAAVSASIFTVSLTVQPASLSRKDSYSPCMRVLDTLHSCQVAALFSCFVPWGFLFLVIAVVGSVPGVSDCGFNLHFPNE